MLADIKLVSTSCKFYNFVPIPELIVSTVGYNHRQRNLDCLALTILPRIRFLMNV